MMRRNKRNRQPDEGVCDVQLGDGNLLIYAGTTGGVLEVDADHLVLVSSKKLLNAIDVVVHHGRVDGGRCTKGGAHFCTPLPVHGQSEPRPRTHQAEQGR